MNVDWNYYKRILEIQNASIKINFWVFIMTLFPDGHNNQLEFLSLLWSGCGLQIWNMNKCI